MALPLAISNPIFALLGSAPGRGRLRPDRPPLREEAPLASRTTRPEQDPDSEPAAPHRAAPPERDRSRQRFRVIQDRTAPRPGGGRPTNPVRRSILYAALPVLALLLYVWTWTLALRGGVVERRLQQELEELRVERNELEAERRRLQAPGHVEVEAIRLGLQPAARHIFPTAGRGATPPSE